LTFGSKPPESGILETDGQKEPLHSPAQWSDLTRGYPTDGTLPCTGLKGFKAHSNGSESDDDYAGVLFLITSRWRVIVCKDGIQFILQYRTSPTQPRRWRGRSYPTTREGLRDSIRRHVGRDACDAVADQLNALPDRI